MLSLADDTHANRRKAFVIYLLARGFHTVDGLLDKLRLDELLFDIYHETYSPLNEIEFFNKNKKFKCFQTFCDVI